MEDDGVAPANINVSGSQGVQAGKGNVQNNWLLRPPPDVAAFAALSPHAAITRIRALSHDDAVDLFAKAPVRDLAEKVRALLLADEPRAIAILADLDPGKAARLISPRVDDFPWLADLPAAAEAIAQRAVDLKWHRDAGPRGLEHAAQSTKLTDGYFRRFKQGHIYWRNAVGKTYAVPGPIAEYHLANGGTGELGFPVSEELSQEKGPRGKVTQQTFEDGYIVSSGYGTYWIPATLAAVHQVWLGFPVSAVETRNGVAVQRFEGGFVYSSDEGTFTVCAEVADHVMHWPPIPDEMDPRPISDDTDWRPISDEECVNSSRTTGRVQRFKHASGVEAAVYSSSNTGVHDVTGPPLALYERLGGTDSNLGLPTSDSIGFEYGWSQEFEYGAIYGRIGCDPVAVPSETEQLVSSGQLGWPVSEERALSGNADVSIQFFEYGVVTLRDGKREIWLRPTNRDR